MSKKYSTQNDLLYHNLMEFYKNKEYLDRMLNIINGESKVSLRIVDWFATNYSKKHYTLYNILHPITGVEIRFKVYIDYKLKLKAYQKKRFDPFCRWDRITIPYGEDKHIQTTLGQLNFFKWAIENKVIDYIEAHYQEISADQESRGSGSRKKEFNIDATKTRKKREELSILASKSIKKEEVSIVVKFT